MKHIDDEQLASLFEVELGSVEIARVLRHLDRCRQCEERIEPAVAPLATYRRSMDTVYADLSKLAWQDLGPRLDRLEASRRKVTPFRSRAIRGGWVSAIAATILIGALLVWPRGDRELRAETLLLRAETAAERSVAARRLRVQTRNTSFVRPAVLRDAARGNEAEDQVRARFAAARFDWDRPLSPKAFLDWRRAIAHKTDRVAIATDRATGNPKDYLISTSTEESALKEASLTIEASGMLPVSARFVFADREWVEVTALPDAGAPELSPTPAILPPVPHASTEPEPRLNAAERELKVRAAIDTLGSDAANRVTVDVAADGAIAVTPYHLGAEQERKLRASLEPIEAVTVLPAPDTVRDVDEDRGQSAPADLIVEASQSVAAQAHDLGQLARRFDAKAESTLSEPDRKTLGELRTRHASRLIEEIDLLWRSLGRDRPSFPRFDSLASAGAGDEVPAAALVDAADALNRSVMQLYATADSDPAATSHRLAAELARLRRMALRYASQLEAEAGR